MSEQQIQSIMEYCNPYECIQYLITLNKNHKYSLVQQIYTLLSPVMKGYALFRKEYAFSLLQTQQFQKAWDIYKDLVDVFHEDEQLLQQAQQCIEPIISIKPNYYTLYQETYKSLPPSFKMPLITLTMTTCKRFDLFEQTMNSFLRCCKDLHLITRWLCIDDNSSEEDRIRMTEKYPFFEFYFKTPQEKGHANSMNILLSQIDTPYFFHMEDDWLYYREYPYLTKLLEVVNQNHMYGQALVNRNYAELPQDVIIKGSTKYTTKEGTSYLVHYHQENYEEFAKVYGHGPNCAYWPHYSLRPGLNKTHVIKSIGNYRNDVNHFEMEFAYRYITQGHVTAFLNNVSCKHIGRLTSEKDDPTKLNAYVLNNEAQFTGKEKQLSEQSQEITPPPVKIPKVNSPFKCFFVNLDTREDRLNTMIEEIHKQERYGPSPPWKRYRAVNGYKLKPSRFIEHIFNPCDFNYRKGIIGCALSHIDLWCQLLQEPSEVDYYIVVEDDVELSPNFFQKVRYLLMTKQQSEWDLVLIGHHIYDQFITDSTYDRNIVPEMIKVDNSLQYSRGGTGGYIINKQGTKSMLDFIQHHGMTNAIDTMIQKNPTLQLYYTNTHLIFTPCLTFENMESIDTDIQRNYDSLGRSLSERLKDEKEALKDLNIPYRECDGTRHVDKSEYVIFCNYRCDDDYTYLIETQKVHVPDKYIYDIGMLQKGVYQVQHMIEYI